MIARAMRREALSWRHRSFNQPARSENTPTAELWIKEYQPMADNGLITRVSRHAVKATIDRLESAVKANGLTVFARVDHAAGAASVGLPLRPTELLIFGNARGGTPLMQLEQTVGIDLPLKALAWEDAAGKTWLSYNDPAWLAARHGVGDQGAAVATALGNALAALAQEATSA
jgi:uncharacterized protein (DUF302 family)